MDKKIISLSLLLVILVSIAVSYAYLSETNTEEKSTYDSYSDIITDEELFEEIDNIFLDEEDEMDIGEMV